MSGILTGLSDKIRSSDVHAAALGPQLLFPLAPARDSRSGSGGCGAGRPGTGFAERGADVL